MYTHINTFPVINCPQYNKRVDLWERCRYCDYNEAIVPYGGNYRVFCQFDSKKKQKKEKKK